MAEGADLLFDLSHVGLQTALGGGKIRQVQYPAEIGFLQTLLLGKQRLLRCLQPCYVHAAGAGGVGHLVGQLIGGLGVLCQLVDQRLGQQLRADMLAVGTPALGVTGALVVVGGGKDHGGVAGGAADQAGQPMLQLAGGAGLVSPLGFYGIHTLLCRFPGLQGDQGRMAAVGGDDILVKEIPPGPAGGVPAQLPNIDGIADDILHGPVLKRIAPMGAHAHGVQLPGDGVEALAGDKTVEDPADQLRLLFLRDQGAVFHPIAEGGRGLELSPAGVDLHAALDLLAQADGIELVHPLNDSLNERTKVAADQGLGDADHVHAALGAEDGLIKNALLLVPGETGELPEQQNGERVLRLLGGGYHPHELRPALGALAGDSGVNIDVVLQDQQTVALGVLPDLLQLALRGQLCLLVCGDADVDRREAGAGGSACHGGHLAFRYSASSVIQRGR